MVLNGVENLLLHDRDFFISEFLEKLIENCPSLTIMISSCEWIGIEAIPNIQSTIVKISELDRLDSVDFFLQRAKCNELMAHEVF